MPQEQQQKQRRENLGNAEIRLSCRLTRSKPTWTRGNPLPFPSSMRLSLWRKFKGFGGRGGAWRAQARLQSHVSGGAGSRARSPATTGGEGRGMTPAGLGLASFACGGSQSGVAGETIEAGAGGVEVGLYAGSPSRAGQNDSIAASCGCGLATMRSSYSRGPRGIREQELDDYNLNLNKAGHEGTAVCCPASLSLAFPVRINPTREPKPAVAATVVANTCCRKLLSNGSNHGSKGREFRAFALI